MIEIEIQDLPGNLTPVLRIPRPIGIDPDPAFHLDTDPASAFNFDADPDFHIDADSDRLFYADSDLHKRYADL